MHNSRMSCRPAVLTLYLLGMVLAACARAAPSTPEPQIESSPTGVPTATAHPTEPPAADQACIDCHTDREKLVATLDQVEDRKPESSGEG